MPPLNWLRAFETSARLLSFTAAAKEMNITQSAVSQQIKLLEAYLGQPLFLRRPRGLQLSDAGRAYLPTVEGAFKLLEQGTQSFFGGEADSLLEVHGNLSFATYWLAPRLGGFLARHPWVRLHLATAIWSTEYARPFAAVEIRFGAGDWEGDAGALLFRDESYPVCAPDVANRLDAPERLLDTRLIDLAGMAQTWNDWFEAAGVATPRGFVHDHASTYVVAYELVRRGEAVGMGHDTVAGDLIHAGALARPFDVSVPMKEGYYLVTPRETRMNRAAKAFRDWLLETVGGGPSRSSPASRSPGPPSRAGA